MTVARFVTLTGGLAGFNLSKRRQPLPETQKLREGGRVLSGAGIAIRAMRYRDGKGASQFLNRDPMVQLACCPRVSGSLVPLTE